MTAQIDAATGQPLPMDAMVRVLYIANKAHIYNIPPLSSNKGHMAASWTTDPARNIFSARVRIVETSYEKAGADFVKVDVLLEDPASGNLFAAAPYTMASVVEPAIDSSRFFAIRVQDPAGRKAILGMGFEDRSEAFDFSIALQDARKSLGLEAAPQGFPTTEEPKKDYSLKAGETITINLAGKFGNRAGKQAGTQSQSGGGLSGFSLPPPPPPAGSAMSLPPPPAERIANNLLRTLALMTGKMTSLLEIPFG